MKALGAVLLIVLPVAGQKRFEQLDRDLARAAGELHISDLRTEVRESGRVVWHRGAVPAPVRNASVETQEVAGQRIQWWVQAPCLKVELPVKRLAFVVCSNSKSLVEAPRLDDGNILRSSIALIFFRDVAGLPVSERDELIAHAFTALYVGDRDASAALVHEALDKFPELESTPDVTLLYLFAQLGLPETEASARASVRLTITP